MKKFFSVGFATIASLLLIFAIIFTAMELTINDQTFVENEFTELAISKSMGISNGDLVKSTMRLIDYMQGDAPDINVDVTLNGETVPMFALEQEHTHMEDVRSIYLTCREYRDYGVLAMLVLFLFAAVINFKKAQQTLAQGYLSGAFIALLFIGFIGTWAISDFSSFWTFFHEALFWNELWLFDATESRMINMLPEQMFADIVGRIFLYAGIAIALLIAASVMALVFTSRSYKKKRAEIIKRQRARKAAAAAAAKARAEARANAKAEREKAKAEKEKAKRAAERKKAKEKAQKKKARGKKGKGGAQTSHKRAAASEAAETQAAETAFDDAPPAYAEDADGYPLLPDGEAAPEGEEVASIDEILRAHRKPWRTAATDTTERQDAVRPAEEDAAAGPDEAAYAVSAEEGHAYADADKAHDRRDAGRAKKPKAKGKAGAASGVAAVRKALAGAGKRTAKQKPKKPRGNVQDDTGFFDE